jgi:hypothetical protein
MLKPGKNLFADFGISKPTLTELEKEEEIIGRGKATFIQVGEALMRVRDKKLYEGRYETFEEYYRQRWGFKKSYAYALMDASEEALKLPEPERPKTEGAARKSLKIRRTTSAIAEVSSRSVPTRQKIGRLEDLCDQNKARIEKARGNIGFQKALKEWLDDSGM